MFCLKSHPKGQVLGPAQPHTESAETPLPESPAVYMFTEIALTRAKPATQPQNRFCANHSCAADLSKKLLQELAKVSEHTEFVL